MTAIATTAAAQDDRFDNAKIAAALLMVANHVLIASPDLGWREWGYLIGRPCIPIFAFVMISRLAADPGRTVRMLRWLVVWAAISQPIYQLLVGGVALRANILATLGLGVALIRLVQRRLYLPLAISLAMLPFIDAYLDGGAATPIAQVAGFALYRFSPAAALAVCTLALAAHNLLSTPDLPAAALTTAAAPILLVAGTRLPPLWKHPPRVTFYAFYPAHLLIIWLVFGPYG